MVKNIKNSRDYFLIHIQWLQISAKSIDRGLLLIHPKFLFYYLMHHVMLENRKEKQQELFF